jgi:carboxypeptidase PM20D1
VLIKQKYGRVAFVLDEGLFVIRGIVPGLAKPCAFIGTVEKGYVTVKLSGEWV